MRKAISQHCIKQQKETTNKSFLFYYFLTVSIHKSNQKIMDIFINRDKNKSKIFKLSFTMVCKIWILVFHGMFSINIDLFEVRIFIYPFESTRLIIVHLRMCLSIRDRILTEPVEIYWRGCPHKSVSQSPFDFFYSIFTHRSIILLWVKASLYLYPKTFY